MSYEQAPRRAAGYRTGRMEAFSDGVFAIAITLLVLEIGVPAGSGTTSSVLWATSGRRTWRTW